MRSRKRQVRLPPSADKPTDKREGATDLGSSPFFVFTQRCDQRRRFTQIWLSARRSTLKLPSESNNSERLLKP